MGTNCGSGEEKGITVRFIVGRAGSGKSTRVRQEIGQRLANGQENLILLVPEQFTLQSERDLITQLNLPGIIQVEVLSFTRLAGKVFSKVGGLTRTFLNEQGKHMVLKKIIDEAAPHLTIYKKAGAQDGFVSKLGELLSDLKVQDVSPAQLRASMTAADESVIRHKIEDIALIYENFNQYLQGRYVDTDDYLNLFLAQMAGASFLNNACIWVDGFTTFSPRSLKIIEKLMSVVNEITISLTGQPGNKHRDSHVFSLSQRTFNKLQTMAREQCKTQEIISLDGQNINSFKNAAITHLERELYAYPGRRFSNEVGGVEIFVAANLHSEIEYAAAQIVELVRERGWRWSDLAVVCNDMSNYGPLIKRVFNEYGIPVFMDEKRDIMDNSIIKLILSSGEVIRRGYRYEDVFSLLKTGFSGLDDDLVEKLENFVLQYGIQGQLWQDEFFLDDEETCRQLNRGREMLIMPLQKLRDKIIGRHTIADFCRGHYEYLMELEVPLRLEKWIVKMNRQGRFEIVGENTQIWNIILEIFDQMVEILGDQTVTLKEYLRILEAGFKSLEVGIIPTTIDQVLVGNIGRSMSHDIKGLLVVGVNDGVLPSSSQEEGILSEYEREVLLEKGVDLGFVKDQRSAEERFLIYTTLSKPSHYLGLSYAMADGNGKALRPSLLIDRIQRLYPQLSPHSDVVKHRRIEMHQIATPVSTYKYLVENMRLAVDAKPIDSLWRDVYRWYQTQPQWQEHLQVMGEGLFYSNLVGVIGADRARRLYALPLYSTVSRVEKFVNCPFAHFIKYGLQPQERKVFKVEAPEVGELFHDSLLAFANRIQQENKDWRQLQQGETEQIIDQIMDQLVPLHNHGIFSSNHRYQYLGQRLKRISRRAVWVLTQHLQQGDFEPLQHEVSFGPGCAFPAIEVELADSQKLCLVGRIDRVDLLEEEECTYIKIIDYKSGQPDLRLSDIYHGLSLQLMIYLQAVLEGIGGSGAGQLKPGGVFYFKIDDPLINTESAIIENIEQEIAKKLKMKGLVLKDAHLVSRLDKGLTGNSNIIPVTLTGDGGFSRYSSVLDYESFAALLGHVKKLLGQIGQEICRGQIRIEPVKSGSYTACLYCDYRAICQFDRRLENNNYRTVRALTDDQVVARINKPKEVPRDANLD